MSERFLITSALPYANGPVHLGHLAGAYLPADIFARFCRLMERETAFICGSDEHGVAITIAAEKLGVTPKDVVDKYHKLISESFKAVGMSFDFYGRTSSPVHHETAQEFFTNLYEKGLFVKKQDEQYFDEQAGMFLPDRYIRGECPVCHNPDAYGDQCEKCGSSLNANDLINPHSAISGAAPVKKPTTHWYLPMGNYQQWLEEWIGNNTSWKPNVLGQCRSWLSAGLADRAMTRDLSWGIPVPLPDTDGKVLYVWFDAPIGYISATKEWAMSIGKPDLWKKFWQQQDTRLIHFIGKDNIVFHCMTFPSILKSHGDYVLPYNVPANEFLNLEGQKFSTSRNHAVWLHEALEVFPADYIRYGVASIMPENKDADFTWKEFQARINNDLADVFGNLVFRTTSFIGRFFNGHVPEPKLNETDLALLSQISTVRDAVAAHLDAFRFKDALFAIMELARSGNKYFTEQEPWKTRKSAPERCATALYTSAQVCAAVAGMLQPFIPESAAKILNAFRPAEKTLWKDINQTMVPSGSGLSELGVPFAKIEDSVIEAQLAKLTPPPALELPKPAYKKTLPNVVFDDFVKLDLRAAKILSAEPVPKSEKLLRLSVDLGYEQRTIMSGIAKHFKPEQLAGKKVIIVANLAPRKIMNVESQGMLLSAEAPDGTLHLLETTAEPGSAVS
jgi:methionyl-tRNA synthetase